MASRERLIQFGMMTGAVVVAVMLLNIWQNITAPKPVSTVESLTESTRILDQKLLDMEIAKCKNPANQALDECRGVRP